MGGDFQVRAVRFDIHSLRGWRRIAFVGRWSVMDLECRLMREARRLVNGGLQMAVCAA